MAHLLLFYIILIYTFGFSILGFAIYKYVKTKKPIIKSFILLWSPMTATTATYILSYYISINFEVSDFYTAFLVASKLQGIAISLIALTLPFFVHKLFNIKNRPILNTFIVIAIVLIVSLFLPLGKYWATISIYSILTFITISNIYSFIILFKNILSFSNKKDKKSALIFMSQYVLYFIFLLAFDIVQTSFKLNVNFPFYPLFYIWIGSVLTYLGVKNLNFDNTVRSKEKFVLKYSLTKREAEIAFLLSEGLTYKQISDKLYISAGTVSTHVMHIYEKTETSSKIQLNKKILKS